MKKIGIILSFIALAISFTNSSYAQEKKEQEKTVKIKMIKIENGKKVKVDTSFVLKEGEDLDEIMKKYGLENADIQNINVELDEHSDGKNIRMILKANDDDAENQVIIMNFDNENMDNASGMVLINSDDADAQSFTFTTDNGDSTHKVMVISSAPGSQVFNKGNGVYIFKSDASHTLIPEDVKPGDTVCIKTIVTVNGKETVNEKEIIIGKDEFSGSKKRRKVIVMTGDDNFSWNGGDKDVFVLKSGKNQIKINLQDADKEELENIKIPKSAKTLTIDGIELTSTNKKTVLGFEIAEKTDVSVRIFDMEGKKIFEKKENNFSGKFTFELPALDGKYILQIVEGKKYAHKILHIKKP